MNNPSVFCDFHHEDLYYGLSLLFEKRLGYSLYRQIGMRWWENGYWQINNSEETAKQYLTTGWEPEDKTLNLNDVDKMDNGIFHLHDYHNKTTHKAITFAQFKRMPIDIVIASIPAHVKPFQELARIKNAKFIFQMGNVFPEVNLQEIPNLLANTLPLNIPSSCHYAQYHQEFATDIFTPSSAVPQKVISSFINVYQHNGGFTDFVTLQGLLPDFAFKSYGGQCRDGSVSTTEEMAALMRRSYFGFHSKYGGDGYGHVLYNWFACGRPVITRISDYKGRVGEELLIDKETCFDLDIHSAEEIAYTISNLSPDKYHYMVQRVQERFATKVNFTEEEKKLRVFMEELQ